MTVQSLAFHGRDTAALCTYDAEHYWKQVHPCVFTKHHQDNGEYFPIVFADKTWKCNWCFAWQVKRKPKFLCDYIECAGDLFEHKFLVFFCNHAKFYWYTFIMVNLSVIYWRGHNSKNWMSITADSPVGWYLTLVAIAKQMDKMQEIPGWWWQRTVNLMLPVDYVFS